MGAAIGGQGAGLQASGDDFGAASYLCSLPPKSQALRCRKWFSGTLLARRASSPPRPSTNTATILASLSHGWKRGRIRSMFPFGPFSVPTSQTTLMTCWPNGSTNGPSSRSTLERSTDCFHSRRLPAHCRKVSLSPLDTRYLQRPIPRKQPPAAATSLSQMMNWKSSSSRKTCAKRIGRRTSGCRCLGWSQAGGFLNYANWMSRTFKSTATSGQSPLMTKVINRSKPWHPTA